MTTVAASSITGSGAKLNGKINPNGRSTSYYFEYGTSTSYGSKGTTVSLGNGTSTANVSGTVTGLKGGTTYHFRVVATSDAGTTTRLRPLVRHGRRTRRHRRGGRATRRHLRERRRRRQPERAFDQLVRRVRHVDGVRHEDRDVELPARAPARVPVTATLTHAQGRHASTTSASSRRTRVGTTRGPDSTPHDDRGARP